MLEPLSGYDTKELVGMVNRGKAIRVTRGLYLRDEPRPYDLAELLCFRDERLALDGYSTAQLYLGSPLTFPLRVMRASAVGASPYYEARRARPNAAFSLGYVRACNPLQALEIMPVEHGVDFVERFFRGRSARENLTMWERCLGRMPARTRDILAHAFIGTDSVPEKRLTQGLRDAGLKVLNNVDIGPYRWDLVLKAERIAIEVDGYQYHKGEGVQRFEIDRQKLNDAVHRGWRALHFTAATIEHHLNVAVNQVKAIVEDKRNYVPGPWKWHRYFQND